MIKTYLIETGTLPDPLGHTELMNGLPGDRAEKITRIRHAGTRKQSFGAGLLLKEVLRKSAKAGGSTELSYNSFGKPFCGGIPFSLSHTENFAALSIWAEEDSRILDYPLREESVQTLVGCDVETIQPYNSQIARRFFTQEEYQCLEETEGEYERDCLFIRYWTRKESVMKLTGLGMALPMDIFDVRNVQAAAVNRGRADVWAESVKEKTQPEYRQAAEILCNRELYFREYRHGSLCITVCSTDSQFAQETVIRHNPL